MKFGVELRKYLLISMYKRLSSPNGTTFLGMRAKFITPSKWHQKRLQPSRGAMRYVQLYSALASKCLSMIGIESLRRPVGYSILNPLQMPQMTVRLTQLLSMESYAQLSCDAIVATNV